MYKWAMIPSRHGHNVPKFRFSLFSLCAVGWKTTEAHINRTQIIIIAVMLWMSYLYLEVGTPSSVVTCMERRNPNTWKTYRQVHTNQHSSCYMYPNQIFKHLLLKLVLVHFHRNTERVANSQHELTPPKHSKRKTRWRPKSKLTM